MTLTEHKVKARSLIKELREEVKENKSDIPRAIKNKNYSEAMHLTSVNTALEYVIFRMQRG